MAFFSGANVLGKKSAQFSHAAPRAPRSLRAACPAVTPGAPPCPGQARQGVARSARSARQAARRHGGPGQRPTRPARPVRAGGGSQRPCARAPGRGRAWVAKMAVFAGPYSDCAIFFDALAACAAAGRRRRAGGFAVAPAGGAARVGFSCTLGPLAGRAAGLFGCRGMARLGVAGWPGAGGWPGRLLRRLSLHGPACLPVGPPAHRWVSAPMRPVHPRAYHAGWIARRAAGGGPCRPGLCQQACQAVFHECPHHSPHWRPRPCRPA